MISISSSRASCALLAACAAVALAACGSSKSSSASNSNSGTASGTTAGATNSASQGAAKPGKIVVGDLTVTPSLDPDGASAVLKQTLLATLNTYDNLVAYLPAPNSNGVGGGDSVNTRKMGPALATSWKLTPHTAIFNLRKGVYDQYGNELTSADVVWSYKRAMGLKATGAFIYGTECNITGVKALGKFKVEYTMSGFSETFLPALEAHYATIYDAKEVKKHTTTSDPWAKKWLADHTAGFGAYDVKSFQPGQSLDLVPSKTYWGQKAHEAIDLIAIPDAASRFTALQKGSINEALDLTPDQYSQTKSASGVHLYAIRGNSLVCVFPNGDVPELANPTVRQAMQYATPQSQIVNQIYKGFGFEIRSVATWYSPGYTDKYWHYDYNIDKAKQLMKQAGYPNGFSSKMYYASDSATLSSLAPILQSSWAQIGVKIKLVPEPTNAVVAQAFDNRNLPLYLSDQASSVLPPVANVGALYRTHGFANVNNYNDAAFNKAAQIALTTTNESERMQAYDQLQAVAAKDPVYIAVAGYDGLAALSGNISGYWYLPDQTQVLRTLKVN